MKIFGKEFKFNGFDVWHKGNQGSNSGLDADKLDGKHASEFLDFNGKASGSLQIGRTFYNVANFELGGTPIEIVIKTKIPFVNVNAMPIIHLHGYAYGQQAPIELKIGYYVFNNTHGWCGAVSMGAWKPQIKLFSYIENNTKYTAIALIGSIYFPRFSINLFDMWRGTSRDYSKDWKVEYTTSTSIVGTTDICVVPYKQVYNASDVGAKPSSYIPTWSEITNKPTIPTKTSQLQNDSGFTTNTLRQTVSSTQPSNPKSGDIWIQI